MRYGSPKGQVKEKPISEEDLRLWITGILASLPYLKTLAEFKVIIGNLETRLQNPEYSDLKDHLYYAIIIIANTYWKNQNEYHNITARALHEFQNSLVNILGSLPSTYKNHINNLLITLKETLDTRSFKYLKGGVLRIFLQHEIISKEVYLKLHAVLEGSEPGTLVTVEGQANSLGVEMANEVLAAPNQQALRKTIENQQLRDNAAPASNALMEAHTYLLTKIGEQLPAKTRISPRSPSGAAPDVEYKENKLRDFNTLDSLYRGQKGQPNAAENEGVEDDDEPGRGPNAQLGQNNGHPPMPAVMPSPVLQMRILQPAAGLNPKGIAGKNASGSPSVLQRFRQLMPS